jgi:hypothetical protein
MPIAQAREPRLEHRRFADFDHCASVIHGLRSCNPASGKMRRTRAPKGYAIAESAPPFFDPRP